MGDNSKGSILLVLCLAALILTIRKTDALVNPQFWAEDGTLFFLEQYKYGVSAFFRDYAGYLHLVPRVIALFADRFFPYSLVPTVYNYSSLFITLLVVLSVFSPRFKLNNKPLAALAIVLVPHYKNEIFLNITNLQWLLAIVLIIVLLKSNPAIEYGNISLQYISDLAIIVICGLTGPFIVFLAPFFCYKYFQTKTKYNSIVTVAVVLISAIQLYVLSSSTSESTGFNFSLDIYSQVIGHKFWGSFWLGSKLAYDLNHYFLSCICIVVMTLMLWLAFRQKNVFAFFFISISCVFILAAFYRFIGNPEILIVPSNGPRYFYIPYLMLTWSLIAWQGKYAKWKKGLLILILISSLNNKFHSQAFIDYDWKSYSDRIGKESLAIPINPEGWIVNLDASPRSN